jgi:DNA-binding NarL/FixJ family response regulator
VLIVDDHPLFRKGLRTLLETLPEMDIIGEAATGQESIELAASMQPDVVLMDLQMPDGGGLAAIRQITTTSPHIHVLVVTLFEDDDSVFAALRAGALGYVLKDAEEPEMMRAIRAVGNGEGIFSPAIASRLMGYFASTRGSIRRKAFPELTDREREILNMIARGVTNAAIAERLTISLKTVRNHVANIYSKLHVADRTQAALRARDAGLGEGTIDADHKA